MKISGRPIAEEIRSDLKSKIQELRTRNIVPKLAIITLGEESAWEMYVRQKLKVAVELGIEAELIPLANSGEKTLLEKIDEINNDSSFHGMIVQRPMPDGFNKERITKAIVPQKDIDGFRSDSPYEVPVWLATKRLLDKSIRNLELEIRNLKFVVIGKGETAGGPIIRGLEKLGFEPNVIDSKTQNSDEILKKADVIVTCSGRAGIVRSDNIKNGVTLIGVGTRGEDGKLKGDYNEVEIENIAGSYTPTPGGVGPVNLSYLFKNLIDATVNQTSKL